jgi:hypothetical protein
MSDLARKDFFVCLGIWLALEIVCFALLPALPQGQTRASLQPWFLFSILAGIAGAYLLSSNVQLKELFQRQDFFIRNRLLQRCLILLVSWLGLLGIGFPLLVISLQLFSKLFNLLKT